MSNYFLLEWEIKIQRNKVLVSEYIWLVLVASHSCAKRAFLFTCRVQRTLSLMLSHGEILKLEYKQLSLPSFPERDHKAATAKNKEASRTDIG